MYRKAVMITSASSTTHTGGLLAAGTALRPVPCGDVTRKFSRRLKCKHNLGGKLDPEPLFKLDDEENRGGRIHSKARELRMGTVLFALHLERASNIRHAPIENLRFVAIYFHRTAAMDIQRLVRGPATKICLAA